MTARRTATAGRVRTSARRLAVLLATGALALAPARARAARHLVPEGESMVAMPQIPEALLAQLLLLADDACDVRYVPGSLDRAAHVEEWLRALAIGGAKRTGEPMRLVALVLDHEAWSQAHLPCPYGMPCMIGARAVALPASGDASTVTLWTGLLGELPSVGGEPMVGTAQEAASLWPPDELATSMMARSLLQANGLQSDPPWVLDLLGHALALDVAHQLRGGADQAMSAFWQMVLERTRTPSAKSEEPLAAELRRQARLFTTADVLLGSDRHLSVRTLRKLQEKAGGALRPADLRQEWPKAMQGLSDAAASPR